MDEGTGTHTRARHGASRSPNQLLAEHSGDAAIDAKRGDYEPARQAVSEFFTNVRAEIERGGDSVFNEAQQSTLRSILDTRDDAITLLARSDPASVDRLVDFYYKYRLAVGAAPPR